MTETTVKERPILFSGEMVRAILDGRKTQTRRIVKPQPEFGINPCHYSKTGWAETDESLKGCQCRKTVKCPYGFPGDRLWVRETCIISPPNFCDQDSDLYNVTDREGNGRLCQYVATHPDTDIPVVDYKLKVTRSIHMPRWASRITLEITDVSVQRLQEISEEDSKAEGVEPGCLTCGENCIYSGGCGTCRPCYRESFIQLWDSINGDGSWESNPWVWAVSFNKLENEQ